jgi:hypothetical protein
VRQQTFTSGVTLTPHKVAVMVTFSREQAEASAIEQISAALISESVGLALDAGLFSNFAGDTTRPPGLFANANVDTIAPTSGGGVNAMTGDIGNLFDSLSKYYAGKSPVFIAAPRLASSLKLTAGPHWDYPIVSLGGARSYQDHRRLGARQLRVGILPDAGIQSRPRREHCPHGGYELDANHWRQSKPRHAGQELVSGGRDRTENGPARELRRQSARPRPSRQRMHVVIIVDATDRKILLEQLQAANVASCIEVERRAAARQRAASPASIPTRTPKPSLPP